MAAVSVTEIGALDCPRHTPGLRTCRPPLVSYLQWCGSKNIIESGIARVKRGAVVVSRFSWFFSAMLYLRSFVIEMRKTCPRDCKETLQRLRSLKRRWTLNCNFNE
jgi:hypothetical protein